MKAQAYENHRPPTNPAPSRRLVLQGAIAAVAAMAMAPGAAPAQTRMSQLTAGYQDQPNGDKRCQICAQFQPPNACRIVGGPISPQGSCRFFIAKSSSTAAAGGKSTTL
jgi:hypothetical protein